jgi:hypothetical protein
MMMIDGRSTGGCKGQLTPPFCGVQVPPVYRSQLPDLSHFGLGLCARRHFVSPVLMLLFSFRDNDEDRKEPGDGSKHNARSFLY